VSISKRFIEAVGTSKWEALIDKYEATANTLKAAHQRFLNKHKHNKRILDRKNTRED
jgi:hypothetical protein